MQRKDTETDLIQVKVLDIEDMIEENKNVHINQDVVQDHVHQKGATNIEKVLDTLTEIGKGEDQDHQIEKEDGRGINHLIEKEGGRGLDPLTEREESVDHKVNTKKTFDKKFLIFVI